MTDSLSISINIIQSSWCNLWININFKNVQNTIKCYKYYNTHKSNTSLQHVVSGDDSIQGWNCLVMAFGSFCPSVGARSAIKMHCIRIRYQWLTTTSSNLHISHSMLLSCVCPSVCVTRRKKCSYILDITYRISQPRIYCFVVWRQSNGRKHTLTRISNIHQISTFVQHTQNWRPRQQSYTNGRKQI